eukprot:PITA_21659
MERGKSPGYSSQSRKGRSKSKSGIVCWECEKKGHLKKDCKSQKGKKGDVQQENNHEANVIGDVLQDDLILSLENIIDAWVVDSGASFHATPDMKHFHDYVKGYFGQVRLGDDKPCKIIGMGIVFIKQQNGNQWLLKEVSHVPDLKKNLISTGKSGGANTTLWHHRLGHMSEKGTQILHSRNLFPGKRLKCLRLDNGGEYCSKEFDRYCSENGIREEKIVPRTPQQNGMSERMNGTIMECARCMRLNVGLPLQFWEDVVDIVVYLINKGPSSSLDGGILEEG